MLPKSLKTLQIYGTFDSTLHPGCIPPNVKSLYLSHTLPIEKGVLPDSIRDLTFGYSFNGPVEYYPSNLEVLSFYGYNQPFLPGSLPKSLRVLQLGTLHFGQLAPNSLPENLEVLIVTYSKVILDSTILPPSCWKLTVTDFSQSIKCGDLSTHIRHLNLGVDVQFEKDSFKNMNLETLKIGDRYCKFKRE
ncbi:hypothetical protein DLAC_08218 [Tieghemostelium lacteum]|uniref:Uncharacterized protein n=1 Tax=Tieghemostelium lacteum TaxID=361077 RepID=A0A151ZBG2_TIELA|nr:hypothetical protein DLAC_08218 [Tieghemostelium lacteum]|eukprot:KYQ91279.1 hypothetical protein DLAC_08218 [Tieghemostelium lacteum]